jgi:gas vesicle protein
MTSSARLQTEADAARAGLSTALDDLRNSVTTTALTNGAMTFAKEGSTAVARAAIDRALASPLAAMLIGAGIVMMMTTTDKSTPVGGAIEKGNDGVRQAAAAIGSMGSKLATAAGDGYAATRDATGSVLDTAKLAADKVSSTASQASSAVSDAYGKATDAVSGAYDKTKEAVEKGQAQGQQALADAQKLVADTQTRLEGFAKEQPVLVAALGLAFGAALGASLPITEAERKYMGAAGKAATDKGTDMAKKVADSVTGTLAGSDVGAKVGELANAVSSTVTQGLTKSS